jgi:hypothetical protein
MGSHTARNETRPRPGSADGEVMGVEGRGLRVQGAGEGQMTG